MTKVFRLALVVLLVSVSCILTGCILGCYLGGDVLIQNQLNEPIEVHWTPSDGDVQWVAKIPAHASGRFTLPGRRMDDESDRKAYNWFGQEATIEWAGVNSGFKSSKQLKDFPVADESGYLLGEYGRFHKREAQLLYFVVTPRDFVWVLEDKRIPDTSKPTYAVRE